MGLAQHRPAPQIAQHPNVLRTRAHGMLYCALNMFVEDCKSLVASRVQTSIKRQLADMDPSIHQMGESRKRDLARWQDTREPLAWGTDSSHATQTYALLVNILSDDPEAPTNIKHATEKIGYTELARRMVRMSRINQPSAVAAPVRLKGSFLSAMKLAFILIRRRIKHDIVDERQIEDYISQCMAYMMQKMCIQFVPWHKENKGGTTQARAIDYRWWITIKRKPEDAEDVQGDRHRTREQICWKAAR
jgi:hypothetical protein